MDKSEIISTRVGGLGSSDAKMVSKISRNKYLSDADNQRLAIMLGFEERKDFTSKPIQFGNLIEENIFELLTQRFKNAISNPYYISNDLTNKYGFKIFNHIDYEIENDTSLIWIENKATKAELNETIINYSDQLAWHNMLLKEKAKALGKQPILMISHYKVNDYVNFDSNCLTLKTIDVNIDFSDGFKIISDAIKVFKYEPREELFAQNLPIEVQEQLQIVSNYLKEIDNINEKIDKFKNKIHDLMVDKNIKSIDNEYFKITFANQTTSKQFDKKLFEKSHPELKGKFDKSVTKKSYVTLKLK